MPIPTPHAQESETDFMKRVMSDEGMKKDYPQEHVRQALAYGRFRTHNRYAVTDPLQPTPVKMPYPQHPRDRTGKKMRLEMGEEVAPGAIDADEGMSESSSP